MNRRKFLQHGTLASAAFAASFGIGNPKPADGFILWVGRLALEYAFGMFLEGAFDWASGKLKQRRQEWFGDRLDAQLAQEQLISRSFSSSIYVAEVEVPEYNYVLGATRQQNLGQNIAFAFPRLINSQPVVTRIAGPAAYGIAYAAKHLKQNTRMTTQDIRRVILPPPTVAAIPYDDWEGWESKGLATYPNDYSSTGVKIRYEPIHARQGGKGIIEVNILAERDIYFNIPVHFS